ncbi:hypothetical protein SLEP1_g16844 [Rubroshorea leprosula]|uniref:Cytochrome P450 n=1 Tax=Rubroshorea leprosula TaxID=152421 RepID=A0AAV5ISA5_9ROSI|nr:hypothetical protein SLEP1_g16844 [Rubroshorea leprosula]
MAEKYGPIFTIKLGMQEAVVVSNWEVAEECLTTKDKAFANRPKLVAAGALGSNNSLFGMASYGPYRRHVRKIVIRDLLSFRQLEMLKHVQEAVVKEFLQESHQLWSKKKDNSKSGRWKKALRDFFELNGKFIIADAFPFLRWLDISGEEKLMKKAAKELEKNFKECLQEHKRRRASGEVESDQDFMDVLLSTLSDTEWCDAESINKAISLIQRDSRVWSAPDDFRPERFLTSHKEVNVKGQHFPLIPFSSGRRMCPAASFALASFALQVLQLTLIGLTNLKATPLEVLISLRLPASSCGLI